MDTKPINKELVADAYEVLSGIPEEFIYLNRFVSSGGFNRAKKTPRCGTLACGLGWLAMHPAWRRRGLRLESDLGEWFPSYKKPGSMLRYTYGNAADALFGSGAYDTMFTIRGSGRYDAGFLAVYPDISDKELLLARMEKVYYGEE